MKPLKTGIRRLPNRDFFLLLQGHAVSTSGTALFDVALVLWLTGRIESAAVVGIVLMVSNVPEIILGPIGGTLADMFPRRITLIVSDLLIGLVIAIAGIVCIVFPGNATIILVIPVIGSVLVGIFASCFNPAVSAFIPELVSDEGLQSANAAYRFVTGLSSLVGRSLGGVLFTLVGAPVLFLANGLSYLFSAWSESRIRVAAASPGRRAGTAADSFGAVRMGLKEGFRYIGANPVLRDFLVVLCLYHFFVSPLTVVLPYYIADRLNASRIWYGYLTGSFGAGMLTGFALAAIFRVSGRKRTATVTACFALTPVMFFILGLCRNVFIAPFPLFGIGLLIANIVVNLNTVIQLSSPNRLHGRIFGLYQTLSGASLPVGLGFFGILLEALKERISDPSSASAYIFTGSGIVLFLVSFIFVFNRRFRTMLNREFPEGQGTEGTVSQPAPRSDTPIGVEESSS